MGRWAQRRVRGGGPPTAAAIEITIATHDPIDDFSFLDYSADITGIPFNAADYTTNPSGLTGIAVNQTAPDQISVLFAMLYPADTSISYTGSEPGILTPQTVNY